MSQQDLPTGRQLTALDPVFRERPHAYLDRLRAEDPVHRDSELGRLIPTGFDTVHLRRRRTFLRGRAARAR